MNEIYIDVGLTESRVAVIDDGELAEIYIERENRERVSGNIYKGIVENVLPGMQAAFINIGLEKNAFLYIKDAVEYDMHGNEDIIDNVPIGSVLKNGEEIIVQVSKEPIDSKGARVTTHITLPGRFLVLMPNVDYIGISRRIEDSNERERLKAIVSKIKPVKMGIIARTEAEGKNNEDFVDDLNFQIKLWDKIGAEGRRSKSPKLIHKDLGLVYRAIRDLLNRDTTRVVINQQTVYKKAVELVDLFSPDKKGILEYYGAGVNIMAYFGIEEKIERALSRKVWLKCGGYIIIDHTEALTAIDVNTGKYIGSYCLKDTVLIANVEAAKEIARQLRLRDIGGIIIIDFIDMYSEEHRAIVTDTLKSELKKDRTKSSVFGITHLGLVEMTRKKVGKKLSSIMQKHCPVCGGSGFILDEDTIIRNIERKLECVFKETSIDSILIEVNDLVENYIKELNNGYIKYLEETYNKKILLKGLSSVGYSEIRIKYIIGATDKNQVLYPIKAGDKIEMNSVKSKYLNSTDRYNSMSGIVKEIIVDINGNVKEVIVSM